MKVEQMRALVDDALSEKGFGSLVFVVPGESKGYSNARRVLGQNAEILCVNSEGDTVCRFDAKKLDKFLKKNGA